ncbi:MAG: sensor histidine kinase [Candidatus Binatia bacterium]
MATKDPDAAQELRGKTDQSLEDERDKTDELLDHEMSQVEEETSETIRRSRIAADTKRADLRAEVDLDKEHLLGAAGVEGGRLDDDILARERERSDAAQVAERKREDRARERERFQKRLIAEAVLEAERKETDSNLHDERAGIDLESELRTALLSDETTSHDLTKAALITRDQYLAIVSHDLRNSLFSISVGAHVMRGGLSRDKVDAIHLLEILKTIEQGAAGMDRMISDLLDVERMSHDKLDLRLEEIDLLALLKECVDMFDPVVTSKSFSMTIHAGPEPIVTGLDHDRILQVLSNLIGNSLKFTPKGGAIELSLCRKGAEVEISVSDNGPGIPEQARSRVFEKFSQLKTSDRRGLGLGLFIAKWIVEAHGGRIWVAPGGGTGSTFCFTLPIAGPASATAARD